MALSDYGMYHLQILSAYGLYRILIVRKSYAAHLSQLTAIWLLLEMDRDHFSFSTFPQGFIHALEAMAR